MKSKLEKIIDSNKIEIYFDNKKIADVPIELLADKAPEYDRKWKKTKIPNIDSLIII